jgi:phage terminase small subunit
MNRKQQAFVCEMLRHGNKAEAYRAAYKPQSDNPRSIESASNRLMKTPEVAEAIRSVQQRIYAEVQEELKARMLHEALTMQRKREILAQIAEGQWIMQPPPDSIEGKPTAVLIPTLKERLKTIDMDNRMTGAYTAKQTAQPTEEEKHNKTQHSPEPREKETTQEEKLPREKGIYAPVPGGKKHPFVLPFINSDDPLLNRSANGSSKLQLPRIRQLSPVKPAWLQTIRV